MMNLKQTGNTGDKSLLIQSGKTTNFAVKELTIRGNLIINKGIRSESEVVGSFGWGRGILNKIFGRQVEEADLSPISHEIDSVINRSLILPKDYYRRNQLFCNIVEALKAHAVLVVTGSSGMGKTSVVFDVCKEGGEGWGIVRLIDYNSDSAMIRDILARLLIELRNGFAKNVIIDDLEIKQDIRPFVPVLKEIIEFQQSHGNKVIITCNHAMDSFLRDLGLCKDQVIAASLFSEDEVDGYLKQLGCGNETLRKKWKTAVYLHSSAGHPQMVNAIATGARGNGFPEIDLDNLLSQPKEVKSEQDRARIVASKLDDSSREMLYRLSLVTKTLSKTQILNIASMAQPIKEAGNILDKLIGPWIEEVGQDMYKISPLIKEAGKAVNGDDWCQKLHLSIAWALIKGKKITAYDISSIIFHSIMGKSTAPMIPLVQSLMTSEKKIWEQIAEHDIFLSVFAPDSRKAAEFFGKKDDMFTLFPLRILQYRVADAKKDVKQVQKILQNFNEEFPKSSADQNILLARVLFLSAILMNHYNECIPYEEVLDIGLEYISLSEKLKNILSGIQPSIKEGEVEIRNLSDVASITLATQIKNTADLEHLIKVCEISEKDVSVKILSFAGSDEANADFILSGTWLSEHRLKNPDWDRYLNAIGKLYDLSKNLSLLPLAREAGKVMVRVMSEQKSSTKEALILSDKIANELGDYLSLKEGRARLKFSLGDENSVREAVAIWDEVLPQWKRRMNLYVEYSYSDAARAAAKLGDIQKALSFFIGGSEVAMTTHNKIAFLFDAGFCYWKMGDNPRAFKYFMEVVNLLQNEQKNSAKNPLFTIQKRLGYILSSIGKFSDGALDLSLPELVGLVSNFFNTLEEDGELKQTPIEYIIFALLQFEVSENLGKEGYNMFYHAIEKKPELQTAYLSSVTKKALEEDDAALFAEAILGYVMMLESSSPKLIVKNDLLKDYFILASVVLLEKNKLSQRVIELWKEALNKNQYFYLDHWFKAVIGILISKDVEAEEVMQRIFVDIKEDELLRYIAALSIINDNLTSSPVNLIDCQSFILERYKAFGKSEPSFATSFGKMVTKSWLRMIKNYPKYLVKLDENISGIHDLLQGEINDFDGIVKVIRAVRVVVNMHENSFTDAMLKSYARDAKAAN